MKIHHTPGSWKYHLGRGAHPRLHIQTEAGYQIACTPEVSRHKPEAEEQEANAKLFAAAPELLSALQMAGNLVEIARQHFPQSMHNSDRFTLEQTCAAISGALARANGE